MPASPSMNVIPLRVEAVLRKAGSYGISPSWRRSVARIVPSEIGISTSVAVRLSRIVRVSSATPPPYCRGPVCKFCRRGTQTVIASRKGGGSDMGFHSLKDVLQEQLEDLYSAETQLTEALPKMAQAAHHDQLREAFEHHLEETRDHLKRVKEALGEIGVSSPTEVCEGMKGLITEGEEMIEM